MRSRHAFNDSGVIVFRPPIVAYNRALVSVIGAQMLKSQAISRPPWSRGNFLIGKNDTRYDVWYGGSWPVAAHERLGDSNLAVVSVQFSVPRDPPKHKYPAPRVPTKREMEPA